MDRGTTPRSKWLLGTRWARSAALVCRHLRAEISPTSVGARTGTLDGRWQERGSASGEGPRVCHPGSPRTKQVERRPIAIVRKEPGSSRECNRLGMSRTRIHADSGWIARLRLDLDHPAISGGIGCPGLPTGQGWQKGKTQQRDPHRVGNAIFSPPHTLSVSETGHCRSAHDKHQDGSGVPTRTEPESNPWAARIRLTASNRPEYAGNSTTVGVALAGSPW